MKREPLGRWARTALIVVKTLTTVVIVPLVLHVAFVLLFLNPIVALLFGVVPIALVCAFWVVKQPGVLLLLFVALVGIGIWLAPSAFSSFECAPGGCN